VNKSTGDKENC